MEDCALSVDSKEFIRTSSLGNDAFIVQRSFNILGRFLTIVEYRGGGRRGLFIISKEMDGRGWRKMAMELHAMYSRDGKIVEKDQSGVTILK